MHPIALRFTKGLGDTAIYARMRHGAGVWDFSLLGEVPEETPGCRVFLAELADSSVSESWYVAEISPPAGGPYPIEIFLAATGEPIGNDIAPAGLGGSGGNEETPDYPGVPSPIAGQSVTRGQFAVKVLQTLGVYDRTAVDNEEHQNVLDAYDAVYLELKDDGLVTWSQTGEDERIPLRFLLSLVSIVAATDVLLATYPQTAQQVTLLKAAAAAANVKIRRQLASAQPAEPTAVEYF